MGPDRRSSAGHRLHHRPETLSSLPVAFEAALVSQPGRPHTPRATSRIFREPRVDHLIALLQQYGLGFVFVNVLALQAGLPLPAYPTLIVAGAYAAMGGNPLWQLVAVGILGSII